MKICLIGEGAQAETHMQALAEIDGASVTTLAGGIEADTRAFAEKWGIAHWSLDLATCLDEPDVDVVINTGPSQLHVEQTLLAVDRGKHVLLEIPMALNYAESAALAKLEASSGLICMVCHTRHFMTGLRTLKAKIERGEFNLRHVICQTYFFRRVNINRFGQPRTWKDDLLWHHACHAVDLTRWLLDDDSMSVWGQVGPDHPDLGIPMDLSVAMRSDARGAIATIAHSFNNHGAIQTPMRFIGEEETYQFVAGVLTDHKGNECAKGTGHEAVVRQNEAFFESVRTGREPETSFRRSLVSMAYLDQAQQAIDAARS